MERTTGSEFRVSTALNNDGAFMRHLVLLPTDARQSANFYRGSGHHAAFDCLGGRAFLPFFKRLRRDGVDRFMVQAANRHHIKRTTVIAVVKMQAVRPNAAKCVADFGPHDIAASRRHLRERLRATFLRICSFVAGNCFSVELAAAGAGRVSAATLTIALDVVLVAFALSLAGCFGIRPISCSPALPRQFGVGPVRCKCPICVAGLAHPFFAAENGQN